MTVDLTDEALTDLTIIQEYIARESPKPANKIIDGSIDCCEALARTPFAYPIVPRYAESGIRRRVYRDYLILFVVEPERVIIIHIVHGARDYEALLFAGMDES